MMRRCPPTTASKPLPAPTRISPIRPADDTDGVHQVIHRDALCSALRLPPKFAVGTHQMQPAVRPNAEPRGLLQKSPGMYRLLLHHRDRSRAVSASQVQGWVGSGSGRRPRFLAPKVELGYAVEDEVLILRGGDHGFGDNLSLLFIRVTISASGISP